MSRPWGFSGRGWPIRMSPPNFNTRHRRTLMQSMEEIEMDRRRKALDKDVASLLDKYLRAMEWDIPEADEAKARQLILDEMKQAISRLEGR